MIVTLKEFAESRGLRYGTVIQYVNRNKIQTVMKDGYRAIDTETESYQTLNEHYDDARAVQIITHNAEDLERIRQLEEEKQTLYMTIKALNVQILNANAKIEASGDASEQLTIAEQKAKDEAHRASEAAEKNKQLKDDLQKMQEDAQKSENEKNDLRQRLDQTEQEISQKDEKLKQYNALIDQLDTAGFFAKRKIQKQLVELRKEL